MQRFELQDDEIRSIQALLAGLSREHESVEEPSFHQQAPFYAHDLPRRLRAELLRFKLQEPDEGVLVVAGYPIDQSRLGPTPPHWNWQAQQPGKPTSLQEEMLAVLLGSLLGHCIGWATQQDGRVVHDLLPIAAHRHEQIGSGSEQALWWHTEDAFHPFRGDYIGMACLRNPDHVPTTYASLAGVKLDPRHLELLFEPHFTIQPDQSHQVQNNSAQRVENEQLRQAYERIQQLNREGQRIAVLFGDPAAPYLRLDPYFMGPADSPEAQEAFDALCRALDAQLREVALAPGDVCLIDNFKAVHGRKPFKARYDGTDRWLKRINVVRDLRKSRTARSGAASHVIF